MIEFVKDLGDLEQGLQDLEAVRQSQDSSRALELFGKELEQQDQRIDQLHLAANQLLRDLQSTRS